MFNLLFDFVQPKVSKMHYWRGTKDTAPGFGLTPEKKLGRQRKRPQKDEMLLTLMKLKTWITA